MKIIVLLFFTIFFQSCFNNTNHNILPPVPPLGIPYLIDTLYQFQASGDISFTFNGERFFGKVDMVMNDQKKFECSIYNPFSMLIASIISSIDSVFIETGDEQYRTDLKNDVNTIPFFSNYPFNFNDFIRILTGRIIKKSCVEREIYENRIKEIECICDSLEISILLTKRGLKVKKITYTPYDKESWCLTFSSFKNGFSKEIFFKSSSLDNFSLKLKKIK